MNKSTQNHIQAPIYNKKWKNLFGFRIQFNLIMRMLERLKNKQKVHTLANGGKYFHFHGLHSYHILHLNIFYRDLSNMISLSSQNIWHAHEFVSWRKIQYNHQMDWCKLIMVLFWCWNYFWVLMKFLDEVETFFLLLVRRGKRSCLKK